MAQRKASGVYQMEDGTWGYLSDQDPVQSFDASGKHPKTGIRVGIGKSKPDDLPSDKPHSTQS